MMRREYKCLLAGLLIVCGVRMANGQGEIDLKPVSQTYVITSLTIIPSPGKRIEGGSIVIEDGLFKAVGKNVVIPPDAIIIPADSLYAYAGFIDGFSHLGVAKPGEENKESMKDPGNPPPARAGIRPQDDVRNFFNPADRAIEDWRNAGFGASQIVPHGNLLPGQAAVILLGDGDIDRRVLVPRSAMYSELTGANRIYPTTIMGVMAKWRELYRQATSSKTYQTTYASNRVGLERPERDRVMEAFFPVIDQHMPVLMHAQHVLDIERALTLMKELSFQMSIGDVKEGWLIPDMLTRSGAKFFLSLDLPDELKPEDVVETSTSTMEEQESLRKRRESAIASYVAQATTLANKGILFGFSSNSAKAKEVHANLQRMIRSGLSEDQALAALTTNPAQMLGVADRLGTVETGKIANLVITRASYFKDKAKICYVFVDGKLYKVNEESAKKPEDKKLAIEGLWTFDTETPQGKSNGKLVIRNKGDGYEGTITNGLTGEDTEIKEVYFEGNDLSFYYLIDVGGSQLKVEVTVTVDGDALEGNITAGTYGSFPMTGKRTPKN